MHLGKKIFPDNSLFIFFFSSLNRKKTHVWPSHAWPVHEPLLLGSLTLASCEMIVAFHLGTSEPCD